MSTNASVFKMAGTEGTYNYIVIAATSLGRVGFRRLNGTYRVRVEPTPDGKSKLAKTLTKAAGWKQPGDGGEDRFSKKADSGSYQSLVKTALSAIGAQNDGTLVNSTAPDWAKAMVASPFKMAGTDKTYEYVVVAVNENGRIGYRQLSNSCYRVRMEPTPEAVAALAGTLTRANGWKQPGDNGQYRFSIEAYSEGNMKTALKTALGAMGASSGASFNPDAPTWAKELATVPAAPPVVPVAEAPKSSGEHPAVAALRAIADKLRAQSQDYYSQSSTFDDQDEAETNRADDLTNSLVNLKQAVKAASESGVKFDPDPVAAVEQEIAKARANSVALYGQSDHLEDASYDLDDAIEKIEEAADNLAEAIKAGFDPNAK